MQSSNGVDSSHCVVKHVTERQMPHTQTAGSAITRRGGRSLRSPAGIVFPT